MEMNKVIRIIATTYGAAIMFQTLYEDLYDTSCLIPSTI